jgi:hypothetical protein
MTGGGIMTDTLTTQAPTQPFAFIGSKAWIAMWLAVAVLFLIASANRYYLANHLAAYPAVAYPKAMGATHSLFGALLAIVIGAGPTTLRQLFRP